MFQSSRTNLTSRVTPVKSNSLSIKAMLESAYTGKAFPIETGPHLSLRFLRTFKAIFYPQLFLEKHIVSSLELPDCHFKWVILKEKARMLLQSTMVMRNLNKQDPSASLVTWLKQLWKNIAPLWKKCSLESELSSECSLTQQAPLQLLITIN